MQFYAAQYYRNLSPGKTSLNSVDLLSDGRKNTITKDFTSTISNVRAHALYQPSRNKKFKRTNVHLLFGRAPVLKKVLFSKDYLISNQNNFRPCYISN